MKACNMHLVDNGPYWPANDLEMYTDYILRNDSKNCLCVAQVHTFIPGCQFLTIKI